MSEELTVLFRQSVHHLFNAARQFSILSLLPFIAPVVFIFLLTGCGEKDTHKSAPPRPVRYVVIQTLSSFRSMCEPEKYVPMMKPCSLSD
jgi:hypothetical protein